MIYYRLFVCCTLPLPFLFLTVQAVEAFHLMTNAPINWRVEENIERRKVSRPTAQMKLAVQQVKPFFWQTPKAHCIVGIMIQQEGL